MDAKNARLKCMQGIERAHNEGKTLVISCDQYKSFEAADVPVAYYVRTNQLFVIGRPVVRYRNLYGPGNATR